MGAHGRNRHMKCRSPNVSIDIRDTSVRGFVLERNRWRLAWRTHTPRFSSEFSVGYRVSTGGPLRDLPSA